MTFLLAMICLAGGLAGPETGSPPQPGAVQLARDRSRGFYGLRATDASLAVVAQSLAEATGARIEIHPELREQRLTARLGARPVEKLLAVLARRVNARLEVVYRLERRPGAPAVTGFARDSVTVILRGAVELREALDALNAPVQVAPGLVGSVRLVVRDRPLAYALDQLAEQLGGSWRPVARLEPRVPVDAAAEAEERQRFHYADLAGLSAADRQAELDSDLERLLRLPESEWEAAVEQRAGDIVAMAEILNRTPGEPRAPVAQGVESIARDYRTVLGRLPREVRSRAVPLLGALAELEQRVSQVR